MELFPSVFHTENSSAEAVFSIALGLTFPSIERFKYSDTEGLLLCVAGWNFYSGGSELQPTPEEFFLLVMH